jgi:hypothetical protein
MQSDWSCYLIICCAAITAACRQKTLIPPAGIQTDYSSNAQYLSRILSAPININNGSQTDVILLKVLLSWHCWYRHVTVVARFFAPGIFRTMNTCQGRFFSNSLGLWSAGRLTIIVYNCDKEAYSQQVPGACFDTLIGMRYCDKQKQGSLYLHTWLASYVKLTYRVCVADLMHCSMFSCVLNWPECEWMEDLNLLVGEKMADNVL